MRDNIRAISAILPDGIRARFNGDDPKPRPYADLVADMRALRRRDADEIAARFPKVQRRVGGYIIDAQTGDAVHMAHLLVGSEGTLAYFSDLELSRVHLTGEKVTGICHFPDFPATGPLYGAHGVAERPDPFNFANHCVAILEKLRWIHRVTDTRRRARGDQIAG